MKKNSLKNINLKFILKKIFDFFKDRNYKYKLFLYSKYFQNICEIKLFDYKEKYYNKLGLKFDSYFCLQDKNNKNLLHNNLKSYLKEKNINYDSLKSYLTEYYTNYSNNFRGEDKSKISIDIYSPFFEILSQTQCFELFIIPIEFDKIEKYNLNKDYIKAFENLKKPFSIKTNFRNEKDASLLKDFKINFGLIQELNMLNIGNEKNINYEKLFKNLFSSSNFGKNLTKLSLKIHELWNKITDSNIFEKINSLKNLESLELNGFFFQNNFSLKSNDLKSLSLKNCKNIILSQTSNLKSLIISNCIILKNESLTKLKNLEKCELLNYKKDQNFNSILDFSSLSNLKSLKCEPSDFIHLTETSILENADLYSLAEQPLDLEKKLIEKIIKLKELKEVNFCIYSINVGSLSNTKNKNTSLHKMTFSLKGEFDSVNFSGLINKFENLSELNLNLDVNGDEFLEMNLKVKENKNCKINNLSISGFGVQNVESICGPYSDLIKFKLENNGGITNLEDTFPLFKNNCQVVFDKLNSFCFNNAEIPSDGVPIKSLNNFCNNLDKIPNLKEFKLVCCSKGITKEFYENFIKKLLEMKLDSIEFEIYEGEINMDLPQYTLEELKEIYPSTLCDKNYSILKFSENNENSDNNDDD